MTKVTRRHAIAFTLFTSLGLASALRSNIALAQSKLSKKRAQYQDTPKSGKKCSGCRHFKAPDACDKVEGTIAPEGWCMLWAPKS